MVLMEAAGTRVLGEGSEPQPTGGLGLRQADQPRTRALADVSTPDMELCDGLGRTACLPPLPRVAALGLRAGGTAQAKPITRQVFSPPGTICR
jgi:hypothetical protein